MSSAVKSIRERDPLRGWDAWDAVLWTIVLLGLLWTIAGGPLTGDAPQVGILILIAYPFLFVHGIRRYGVRTVMVFIVVSYVISTALENMSVWTGFPFGNYYYTGEGPRVFEVPLIIGVNYIALGYVSWQAANALLGLADERLPRRSPDVVLLPVIAGAMMTMFDLTSDPIASTIRHAWIWEDGGGYFGVPLTNFLGWWFVTYLFFQVFAIYLARSKSPRPTPQTRQFWLAPIIMWANLGLIAVAGYVMTLDSEETVTDRLGIVWGVNDIYEACATVAIFTVGVLGILAAAAIYKAMPPGALPAEEQSPVTRSAPDGRFSEEEPDRLRGHLDAGVVAFRDPSTRRAGRDPAPGVVEST
jgi:uncharacterized membrane protein